MAEMSQQFNKTEIELLKVNKKLHDFEAKKKQLESISKEVHDQVFPPEKTNPQKETEPPIKVIPQATESKSN